MRSWLRMLEDPHKGHLLELIKETFVTHPQLSKISPSVLTTFLASTVHIQVYST